MREDFLLQYPQPAERWLRTALVDTAEFVPELSAALPFDLRPALGESADAVPAQCDGWNDVPAAQAADRLVSIYSAPAANCTPPSLRVAAPPFEVAQAAKAPAPCEQFQPCPVAQPAERWATPVANPAALPASLPVLRIPIPIGAAAQPPSDSFLGSYLAEAAVRTVSPTWNAHPLCSVPVRLQAPAVKYAAPRLDTEAPPEEVEFAASATAEPAERWSEPRSAAESTRITSALPRVEALGIHDVYVECSEGFARARNAEAVAAFVEAAALLDLLPLATAPAVPSLTFAPRLLQEAMGYGSPAREATQPSEPTGSVGKRRTEAVPFRMKLAVAPSELACDAHFAKGAARDVHPQPAAPNAAELRSDCPPIQTVQGKPPVRDWSQPAPRMPHADTVSLRFHSLQAGARPLARIGWLAPALPCSVLSFAIEPAQDKPEDVSTSAHTAKAADFKEVVALPQTKHYINTANLGWTGKIAAGLMVAAFLWFGAKMATGLKGGTTEVAVASSPEAPARALDVPEPAASKPGIGARVRHALAERAAVEVGDTFRSGMASWGASGKSLPGGWSRSASGYVHPGDLALFAPTRNFSDYRLEFYGQIESKSLGWVVRARDKNNYYAMKFTVVEPGLRPVIAMVHYPVVGGKKGRRIQTPLSAMFHNNTPYHVTVDVKGNQFTASVEGEEVDSWTDDAARSGGVGFFSEPGERARLYWAKVTKNQDWIGHLCAFFAGEEARRTSELWNPGFPDEPAPPERPRRGVHASARELKLEEKRSSYGEESLKQGRNRWNS
jgi:hypothetical protein